MYIVTTGGKCYYNNLEYIQKYKTMLMAKNSLRYYDFDLKFILLYKFRP